MMKLGKCLLTTLLIAFGLLTLFLSSSIIFDLFGIRAKEGNYVGFIVWANFISSVLYLYTAYGLMANKKWIVKPLLISSSILILAQAGLFLYISEGGIYETKTVYAMFFRIAVTLGFTLLAYLLLRGSKNHLKNQ